MSRNTPPNSKPDLSQLSQVLCRIDDSRQMQDFLAEILTPSERRDLALRWELMRRLKSGDPQRKIARELGISLCKITRGAKILKREHSLSKRYLDASQPDHLWE